MKKAVLAFLGLTLLGFGGSYVLPSRAQVQTSDTSKSVGAKSVPAELLVQFKEGVAPQEQGRAYGRIKAQAIETIVSGNKQTGTGRGDLVRVRYPQTELPSQAEAMRRIQEDPAVDFAEPNWIYTHQATSNDPYYTTGSLWGMYGDTSSPANQYGSQAGEGWAANKIGSSTVYVGVIDEGIQIDHPDLQANVWVNPYDAVDGRDNDGNGYVDDNNGWDFDGNNNTVYDGGKRGTLDDHGTHVAGTIGAVGGNGIGVVGVNWQVKLISAKFLGRNGGTAASAIKAVDYITDLKRRHNLNIVATNNSWGGGGFSQALQDAIERANAANILFIAAAGNGGTDGVGDNNDSAANYPSNYPNANVISVAAITNTGNLSSFSNYGSTTVDLGAPGSGIWSTTAYNTYSSYNGTSMATPHVTGAAALYAAKNSGATAATIKAAILNSVVLTPSLNGKTATGGRLNVSGF
ncbi:MAG TPA: S8 family peptidase [Candidatus Obscuribacterales bacterium]